MIYTVTINPALDYVMDVGEVIKGETNRSVAESITFGGKGINVSVILGELGAYSTALGFVAGFTGEKLVNELEKTGINTDFIYLESGMTRINVKLRSDVITEVNAAGPKVTETDVERLLEKLSKAGVGDTVILSGSVPKNALPDVYLRILSLLENKGVRTVVDTAGKELLKCLRSHPWLVKPNKSELEELCGRQLSGLADIEKAARELQEKGARNVLVSLGGEGAFLLTENGRGIYRAAYGIKPKNTVGAGDSAVAGYVVGSEKGDEYALMLACAAGAATAACDGLATKKDIEKVLSL